MKIKEVEQQIGISKANIRFYEKEGLLTPARQENKYREYNEEDLQCLRKVVLLRKLGVPLPEIKEVFDGKKTLQEVVQTQKDTLTQQIEALNGALEICEQMEKDRVEIQTLNDIYYLELIEKKEKKGLRFNEIYKDWVEMEKNAFYTTMKYAFFFDLKKVKNKVGIKWAGVCLLAILILRGLAKQFIWKNGTFWEGFFYPLMICFIGSVIILPLFLLGYKFSKLAGAIASILIIGIVLFFLLLILGIIILIVLGI